MKEKLKNKKVIVVSSIILVMTIVVLLVITLKDSYAYYGTSNELEIVNAKIGKLKPTIDKVYIEEENQLYTNNPNPNVTITWSDDNITEYCVTTESACTSFIKLSDTDTCNKSVTATNQITLSGEGNYTVNAYIKNKYGYTSAVKSDQITLDTTAPTISSVTSTEITATTITVNVTGSDANGISQYCYSTTNSNYTCNDMNREEIAFTISELESGKNYTVYVYLIDNAGNEGKSSPNTCTFTTISKSAKDVVVATSRSLEPEDALTARNAEIAAAGGDVPDDLRRFVGDKTKVTDNFICFGTTDQNTCKENMDTYMYRIIGIDTQNRLKIIKATKIVKDSSTSTFAWNSAYTSDVKWNNSDLYKGLNGTDAKKYFIRNNKYSYMQDTQWTNLIDKPTYYIGDSTSNTNPTLFDNERKNNVSNADNVGLMYLSDYLYANSGTASTTNWLFIQNGLNGASNTPGGSAAPSAEYEWTMTRYGYSRGYYARRVYNNGTVDSNYLGSTNAVRPVFYLKSDVMITGKGTITEPYMISLN